MINCFLRSTPITAELHPQDVLVLSARSIFPILAVRHCQRYHPPLIGLTISSACARETSSSRPVRQSRSAVCPPRSSTSSAQFATRPSCSKASSSGIRRASAPFRPCNSLPAILLVRVGTQRNTGYFRKQSAGTHGSWNHRPRAEHHRQRTQGSLHQCAAE